MWRGVLVIVCVLMSACVCSWFGELDQAPGYRLQARPARSLLHSAAVTWHG